MVKVITYGTYDLLHHGHIRLLERAKALGDYLIVGVTADDFDKSRGKINVQQSLMERVEAIFETGLADEIIVEEYEGQKIDDIRHYGVDIFTVGSDWEGQFDYLNEYCKVVYLPRTEGVSSSDIRSEQHPIRLGLVGDDTLLLKHWKESGLVNGIEVTAMHSSHQVLVNAFKNTDVTVCEDFDEVLQLCDAVFLITVPGKHEEHIRQALEADKHVLVESPVTLDPATTAELFALAKEKGLVLMESIKTAYATAYDRLLLLVKSGKIGQVVSIDAVCTSMRNNPPSSEDVGRVWSGFEAWMPTALLPAFQILGTDTCREEIIASYYPGQSHFDMMTHINLVYPNAIATARVGVGAKAEGQLVISGTKGYVYVPAPWWKTDYFELRFENQNENRRYFYQLDGEGIRHEIVAFVRAINGGHNTSQIDEAVSVKIADTCKRFRARENLTEISW